jgi:hypothetical protein
MLAAVGDTCVIARANNAGAIERSLTKAGDRDRLAFVYVDLPYWARFWRREVSVERAPTISCGRSLRS